MSRHYDVIIKSPNNRSAHYWADSFSVDGNGTIRIKSAECGDIGIHLLSDEQLEVHSVDTNTYIDTDTVDHNPKRLRIFYHCPRCAKIVGMMYEFHDKYCRDCGLRMEWGDCIDNKKEEKNR